MIKKIPLIAFVSILSTVAVAAEQFSQLDTNKDGAINRTEAQISSDLTENWAKVDMNGDGVVDQTEFSKYEATPSKSDETAG
ncbi:MAG: hypothetical protein ACRERV_02490 [Methylococcales bacterium]